MKNYLALFAVAAFVLSCSDELLESTQISQSSDNTIINEAYIYLSKEAADEIASGSVPEDLFAGVNLDKIEAVFPDEGKYGSRHRSAGLDRWYKLTFKETDSFTKSAGHLSGIDGICAVEPVYRIRPNVSFNDKYLFKQWHYVNDGSLSSSHKAGIDINVEPVWQKYTRGDRKVTVAVVDGGIDREHEDLAANYVGGKNFVSGGQVTADEHGTHVAGTIAAVNNNGLGVCGIAGGDYLNGEQGVGLLSCQIFVGSKSGDGAQALVWAADNGAVIANNSWGYEFDSIDDARNATISGPLKDAIRYFCEYAGCDENGEQLADSPMQGGIVFFAAGNDGWDINPICEYELVKSVGAVSAGGKRASYSNYGDWVDIAAPGGENGESSLKVLSTLPGNSYGGMAGTSMACPHVSGVAALLVSYFGGPGFTSEMLWTRLVNGARTDVLPENADIGPFLDATGAFNFGRVNPPAKVEDYQTSVLGNIISTEFSVTADPEGNDAYGYVLIAGRDESLFSNIENPFLLPQGLVSSKTLVGSAKAGETMTACIRSLDFETDYYVALVAYDYVQNHSELSEIKKIRTLPNSAPVIRRVDGDGKVTLRANSVADIQFEIYDPESEEVNVQLSKSSAAVSIAAGGQNIWNLKINGYVATGSFKEIVTVSDPYGLSATYELEYEIVKNHAPAQIKELDNIYSETTGRTVEIALTDYFCDEDGDEVTFTASSGNGNIVGVEIDGGFLKVQLKRYGRTEVSITAKDKFNAMTDSKIEVMVKAPDNITEMYPNPVSDYLYIRTGELKNTLVRIYSSGGKPVWEKESLVGAFQPLKIDLRDFAPGQYRVNVVTEKYECTKTVVKL